MSGAADWTTNVRSCRLLPDLDLLITFGGDGTIVRAIRSVSQHGVPILGVNLGRLGFLAEVEPDELEAILPALLAGSVPDRRAHDPSCARGTLR